MSKYLIAVLAVIVISCRLIAVEGMWLPLLIDENISDMQQMGLALTAGDVYSEDHASLKDAIVRFGRGCTGSFISADGLILTNHHCGYGQIQSHSNLKNDYLQHGFWAGSREEELPNPGLTVTLLVRMEDVTDRVISALEEGMSESHRSEAVRRISRQIAAEVETGVGITGQVAPFYYGNQYYLFVYQVYRDVRLVGAPPSYIGKYGGDTDNWMWPRHSGDFALFRVYADANNQPTDYHPGNAPFSPRHFLPVSSVTPEVNDFTMIMGYPGSTNQYLTSEAVSFLKHTEYPLGINLRTMVLDIYDQGMKKDSKVNIQYASKHARVSNAWKRWQGEIRGLNRLNATEIKRAGERGFSEWVGNLGHDAPYAGLLDGFSSVYAAYHPVRDASRLYAESVRAIELVRFSGLFETLVNLSRDPSRSDEEIALKVKELQQAAELHFRDYNASIDKRIAQVMLPLFKERSGKNGLPVYVAFMDERPYRDLDVFIDRLFGRSIFVSYERTMKLLGEYRRKDYRKLVKDPAFDLTSRLDAYHRLALQPKEQQFTQQLDSLYRVYLSGLFLKYPDKHFFPDANGTMRIAYGRVEGSLPRDAVQYIPHSSTDGILEKAAMVSEDDYRISEAMSGLLNDRNFGQYIANDRLVVNFIASNHTTGGSSGSPVLNGRGELIGLNFDRSWESTMSDIMFDPLQCRNIAVNAPYILWVIDVYAGQSYLLDEINLKP